MSFLFQVGVNGKPFIEYQHRMDMDKVTSFKIEDLAVYSVRFDGPSGECGYKRELNVVWKLYSIIGII